MNVQNKLKLVSMVVTKTEKFEDGYIDTLEVTVKNKVDDSVIKLELAKREDEDFNLQRAISETCFVKDTCLQLSEDSIHHQNVEKIKSVFTRNELAIYVREFYHEMIS